MKRDWRPTLALIAALLVSLALVWLGREVGTHVERDTALISRLTRDDPRLGSRLQFGRAREPLDARDVDASATADAGTSDAYETPDLATPVIRRYCDAVVRRICSAWTACGCAGMPQHSWTIDEAEVGTCEERTMRACETWHAWGLLRDGLSHPPLTVNAQQVAQVDAYANNEIGCGGVDLNAHGFLINDAVTSQACEGGYACRDNSTCIDGVCTRLPTEGERCLGGRNDGSEEHPCSASGLCAEGLVCAHHRCAPAERFDCNLGPEPSRLTPCPLGEAYNWSERVLEESRRRGPIELEDFPRAECLPVGQRCTRDAECVGQCSGAHTRVCMLPMLHEARQGSGRRYPAHTPPAHVGEDCQQRPCSEGLTCSMSVTERDASTEVGYVCRVPVQAGARCSVDTDCGDGLICGNRYEAGRCEPGLCHNNPLFP